MNKQTLVAAVLLTLPGLELGAQAADETPPPPRYAVEIIIFEHLDQAQSTPEVPPPADPFAPEAREERTGPVRKPLSFLLLDPRSGEADFLEVPGNARMLNGAWQRLERLDAYRPVAHLAWTQRAWPRKAAEALEVGESQQVPAGLEGQITLYKERYLHLAVDLEMAAPDMNSTIRESRRLRGDVAQYFDNPRFGVIAQVRQLEVPATGDEADADTAG